MMINELFHLTKTSLLCYWVDWCNLNHSEFEESLDEGLEKLWGNFLNEGNWASAGTNFQVGFPLRSKGDIFLHILMLEEKVLVTELAGNKLGSNVKISNVNFSGVGFSIGVHLVEVGICGNGGELLCEGSAVKVVWKWVSKEWLKNKLEGELGVSNLFTVLIESGNVGEANILNEWGSSCKLFA